MTKVDTNASGALSLVYSTYLGGAGTDIGSGIAVDAAGNAYVTGETSSSGVVNGFPTKAAFQPDNAGGNDAYVTKVDTNASGTLSLVYSTYLGGSATDSGNGIAVDLAGNAYVTGLTASTTTFPITVGTFDASFNGGSQDAFVAKIGDALVPASVTLAPADAINTVGSEHCVTATVEDAAPAPNPVPGVFVRFTVSGVVNTSSDSASPPTTVADGKAKFCYPGPATPGVDAISAFADTNKDGDQDVGEPGGTAGKEWVPGPPATLTLAPADATNPVGTQHCVIATVKDRFGNATPNITVRFAVAGVVTTTSDPDETTDLNGLEAFCYTGFTSGADTISAFADTDGDGTQDDGSQGDREPGGSATKTWVPGPPAKLTLMPATATNPVDAQHCVTAAVKDLYSNTTPGIAVRFSVTGAVSTTGSATTNAIGEVVFCYTALLPGADTITAYADTDNDNVKDDVVPNVEPTGTAAKTWVLPASTAGCRVTGGGNITTVNGARATFGGNAQSNNGVTRGNQEYQDHGPAQRRNVKSISVLAVVCESQTQATIFGQASVNGSGMLFYRIDVKDMGEPGKSRDSYSILLSDGYTSGAQILDGGNTQIR